MGSQFSIINTDSHNRNLKLTKNSQWRSLRLCDLYVKLVHNRVSTTSGNTWNVLEFEIRRGHLRELEIYVKGQGHWKRNHWPDHTRLTVRRVTGRWILSWPWNVGQRSLEVIERGTIWKFGYGFLTFPTLTLGLGIKVIENGAVR